VLLQLWSGSRTRQYRAPVQTAIYDAVNAIDHTSRAFLVHAHAPADASPVAAAAENLKGVTHSCASFSAATTEAMNSVVWAGVHCRYDNTAGQALGQSVAHFVDQHFFQPLVGNVHARRASHPSGKH